MCIYNHSVNLELEYLLSSLLIGHRFSQSTSNSDLSNVIYTTSSPILVPSKTSTTQNAMPFACSLTSQTFSVFCQLVIRLEQSI